MSSHPARGVAPLLLQFGGRGVSERPIRSFVAVLLPDGVRARLAATVAEIRPKAPALAWVRADNLHLTLRFLGAVEPAALARAQEAIRVAVLARAPFTIELGGLGSFPAHGAPRVVWAGVVAGGEGLAGLHATLEAALVARGIPGEGRVFHPHVTLARARERRGGARLEGLLGAGPRFGQMRVAALHLMRSELGPGGSRYTILAEAPLDDLSGGD
jgi:RNA 2',3'-cyclic 3'-phosphodiesterase